MKRRMFLRGLFWGAASIKALPLLKWASSFAPEKISSEMQGMFAAYYRKKSLDILRKNLNFSAFNEATEMQKRTGDKIVFYRYTGLVKHD